MEYYVDINKNMSKKQIIESMSEIPDDIVITNVNTIFNMGDDRIQLVFITLENAIMDELTTNGDELDLPDSFHGYYMEYPLDKNMSAQEIMDDLKLRGVDINE